jgi:glycosyltransferase involved in cell wall biosynthesis
MKVLMICEFFDEALEYQENLLLRYYRKHGHDVVIVTSLADTIFDYRADRCETGLITRTYEINEARIIRLPYKYNIMNRIRTFPRLAKLLADEQPDLIYLHECFPCLPSVVHYLKHNPKSRAILDFHADYSNSTKNALSRFLLHRIVRGGLLRYARPYLSCIFPVVPASAKFLNEVYSLPFEAMEILPLGADLDVIKEVCYLELHIEVRKRLGIAEDDVVIFSGGKLEPRKRTEILFEALSHLSHHRPHVILVGEAAPEHQEYKKQLIAKAASVGSVHAVGWLSPRDVYAHMAASTLAVFPASQSIMWQQAIATGLPLVVGDTGGQSISYLNLYENIVILDRDEITPERFAKVIDNLLNDRMRLQAMSEGAVRVGREQLDWNTLIERTLRFAGSRACY